MSHLVWRCVFIAIATKIILSKLHLPIIDLSVVDLLPLPQVFELIDLVLLFGRQQVNLCICEHHAALKL